MRGVAMNAETECHDLDDDNHKHPDIILNSLADAIVTINKENKIIY